MTPLPIKPRHVAQLMATGKIDEIECEGMDEGRFFVHLKPPYCWAYHGNGDFQYTQSFGGFREAMKAVKNCLVVPS